MKVLFTKSLDADLLLKNLDSGISAECIPVIKTETLKVSEFNLDEYSVIFTSVNAVQSFFKNNFKLNSYQNKIYAVGSKTEEALQNAGFSCTVVLPNAENLAQWIITHAKNRKFLHFCGNIALNTLKNRLLENNIDYQKVIVYETLSKYPVITEKYHAAVFFSPSGVRSFAKNNTLEKMLLFSIGKTTTDELLNYTKNPIFTSTDNTLANLLQMINKKFQEVSKQHSK